MALHRFPIFILAATLLVASCATFPELDDTVSQSDKDAPYPTLANLDELLSSQPAQTPGTDPTIADSRLASLKARAARLRGPILTRAERRRLQGGVAVPASNG